jgi:hypothetical protein
MVTETSSYSQFRRKSLVVKVTSDPTISAKDPLFASISPSKGARTFLSASKSTLRTAAPIPSQSWSRRKVAEASRLRSGENGGDPGRFDVPHSNPPPAGSADVPNRPPEHTQSAKSRQQVQPRSPACAANGAKGRAAVTRQTGKARNAAIC